MSVKVRILCRKTKSRSFLSHPDLEGYVCYHPQPIDYAEGIHADKKGQMDKGSVVVVLSDWQEQFLVSPPDKLVDYENDPNIIGFGRILFDKDMNGYEKFHLDIN